jgi:Flp pilus assembly protein TadG
MVRNFIRNKFDNAKRLSGRVRNNIEGIAAVEFGFIAPIMLLMLVGTAEVSRAVTIDRRFGLATSMIADLVTREEDMTAANLLKIYDIVEHVMGNYDNGSMKVSVIPVKANPADASDTRVYAEATNRPPLNGGVDERELGDAYALAEDMISAGATVIVVKAEYTFNPIFLNYVFGNATWQDTAILSPRNSCVDFDDNNCVADIFE